jgi:hypothetical protein
VRSKVKWIEQGERNTNYFLNQEKKRSRDKVINKLVADDGHEIVDQADIGIEIVNFYENLYKKQDHDTNLINDFVEDIELPKLSEVEKSSIEGTLTVEECGV